MGAEAAVMHFEGGRRTISQGMQAGLWKLEKVRKQILLWGFWKGHSCANILILTLKDPSQISHLQNCIRTNLCCFKLLSLWLFFTSDIGNSCKT